MLRVSSKIFINNIITNAFKNFKRVQDAHLQIASGKKVNKPSDNPAGMANILSFRKTLKKIEQIEDNIIQGQSWLNLSESALSEITNILIDVNATAEQFASSSSGDTTTVVSLIDGFISDLIGLGNTSIQNRRIFGGFKTSTPPFTSGAVYFGDTNQIQTEFDFARQMSITIPGSDFLAVDMNPDINGDTLLSTLNKGSGVSAGSISITDRAGNSATIDLSGATTVSDVITTISNASGVNVTARINDSGTGFTIEDDNTSITGSLTIAEVSSGSTASNLGILGTRNGDLSGRDLDAEMTSATPLSLLYGGDGLSLNDIEIVNGTTSGTVSFSSLTSSSTIADVISTINASGLNVTAGINSNGTALTVTSTNSSSVAIITESGTGTTASDLGIGGKRNILITMEKLRDALQIGDRTAIRTSLENLEKNTDNISTLRGTIGGRINRLDSSLLFLDTLKADTTSFLSDVEDVNIEEASLELITFQNAYEVTLSSAAQILNITLLNFLR